MSQKQPFFFGDNDFAHNVEDMLRLSLSKYNTAVTFLINGDFEKWLTYLGKADLAKAATLARTEAKPPADRLKDFLTACWLVVFSDKLEQAKQSSFTLLLIGRTGVGESSTVNTLLGRPVAKVSRYDVGTRGVEKYEPESSRIQFLVYDTPGLCDANPDKGNDKRYLEEMRSKVGKVDCSLFVTQLTETRVRPEEEDALRFITDAFGPTIWNRSVIVFTCADLVKKANFKDDCEQRTLRINRAIKTAISTSTGRQVLEPSEMGDVPSVAVSNEEDTTPDGERWLGKLYTTVFERFSDNGLLPFLLATVEARPEGKDKQGRPVLNEGEKVRVAGKLVDTTIKPPSTPSTTTQAVINASIVTSMTLAGTGVGSFLGPVGAVVGGAAGASVGLFVWLTR
jgi:predicted GTPase